MEDFKTVFLEISKQQEEQWKNYEQRFYKFKELFGEQQKILMSNKNEDSGVSHRMQL